MVRYYHRTGVLPEPPRTSAGYRDYQLSDVALLLKLRTLTDAGIAATLHGMLWGHVRRADIVQDALDNVDKEITACTAAGRLFAMQGTQASTGIRALITDLRDGSRTMTARNAGGTPRPGPPGVG